MEIKKGAVAIKGQTSILDVILKNVTISVFQGSNPASQFDIWVKYRQEGGRLRTPKHIHWAVDLLLKKEGNNEITDSFLEECESYWDSCKGLNSSNSFETIKDKLIDGLNYFQKSYSKIEKYGEYSIEFLECLFVLLSIQEKTNRPDAYMFGELIKALSGSKLDIFYIVSIASFRGVQK